MKRFIGAPSLSGGASSGVLGRRGEPRRRVPRRGYYPRNLVRVL